MISSAKIKHKELPKLFEGQRSSIDPRWRPKIERMLAQLNVAVGPEEVQGYGMHKLKGEKSNVYAMSVSRNWRLTFKWGDHGPEEVNLEDYHG